MKARDKSVSTIQIWNQIEDPESRAIAVLLNQHQEQITEFKLTQSMKGLRKISATAVQMANGKCRSKSKRQSVVRD